MLMFIKMLRRPVIFNIFIIVAITSGIYCDTVNFQGTIAENRSISECKSGYKPSLKIRDTKMYITTSQFASEEGYPSEEHAVETDDGYILILHRIRGQPGAPPVFLQHGVISSSFHWLILGKENALAFKLVDAGYDVWLGNFRGNTYCRCHAKYKTSSHEFWDFSWHEMGIHDLPAMISYLKNATSQKLIYIGHSMGTTAFFVMASERPDIASKVKVMFALSPVAYIDHGTSPLRMMSQFIELLTEIYVKINGTGEFLSSSRTLKIMAKYLCNLTSLQRKFCSRVLSFVIGFNSRQWNYTLQPEFFYNYPAGSSVKIFNHYSQEYNSGRFQYYNYGAKKNLKLYGSTTPLEYNISKITVPVGLIWSDSDEFANPIDVNRLYKQLPNPILNYRVEYSNFRHNDFMYSIDASKYVYEKLLSMIDNYN